MSENLEAVLAKNNTNDKLVEDAKRIIGANLSEFCALIYHLYQKPGMPENFHEGSANLDLHNGHKLTIDIKIEKNLASKLGITE